MLEVVRKLVHVRMVTGMGMNVVLGYVVSGSWVVLGGAGIGDFWSLQMRLRVVGVGVAKMLF